MGRVQTSVMIDEDKRALAKQRGIKLQDLLDDALNMALELEIPGKAQKEIERDNILNEIALNEKQKEEYLAKYEKNLLQLEKDKKEFLLNHDKIIDQLNIKLRLSESALAGAMEDQKQLDKLNQYKELLARAVKNGAWDGDLEEDLTQFCLDHNIVSIQQAFEEAIRDLNDIFYDRKTMDDITETPGQEVTVPGIDSL